MRILIAADAYSRSIFAVPITTLEAVECDHQGSERPHDNLSLLYFINVLFYEG